MQILNNEEAAKWCTEHGFELINRRGPHWTDSRISNCLKFLTAHNHSVAEALTRHVVSDSAFDCAIVWLRDWPLYRPDEMAVLNRFRQSTGDERPVIDAPAHVFSADEVNDCVGLFNLCTHYYFDAFLYVPTCELLAYTSHDGIQYISALSATRRAELGTISSNYELQLLK
jgi:hypothetical protein